MILKASQRAGARNLSDHLMNDRDNDHITLADIRGFMADDLHGALDEAYKTWLGKGMTRSHLNDLDSAAYTAYKNLLYYHGEDAGIDLPTKGEQIDLDFATLTAVRDPVSRLALEDEIVALRRIHHLLVSRSPKE